MKNGKAQTGGRLAGFLKQNNMVLLLACGGVLLILFASTLFGGSGQEEQPAAFASETLTNEQFIAQTEQKLQNILNGIQFAPIPLRAIDPLAWVIPGYVHPILINIFNQVVGNGLQNQAMALFQNLPGNQNIIMNEAPNRQGLYVYQGI